MSPAVGSGRADRPAAVLGIAPELALNLDPPTAWVGELISPRSVVVA